MLRRLASSAASRAPVRSKQLDAIANGFRSKLVSRAAAKDALAAVLAHGVTAADLDSVRTSSPAVAKLLSLSYAPQPQLNSHNVQTAVREFARTGPADTGSPEVQAAIMTVKLAYLATHCQTHKHDYKAARQIVQLVHERKRMLKYLKRVDLARFVGALDRLGLAHDYLEGFENGYLFKYRK